MKTTPLIVRRELNRPEVCQFSARTRSEKLERCFDKNIIFMQDNAPPHTSRVAGNFLEMEGVTVLEWLSCSPDLNSIEHL